MTASPPNPESLIPRPCGVRRTSNACPYTRDGGLRAGFASGKLHSFRMPGRSPGRVRASPTGGGMRALNERLYGRADSPRYGGRSGCSMSAPTGGLIARATSGRRRALNERPYGRADSPRYIWGCRDEHCSSAHAKHASFAQANDPICLTANCIRSECRDAHPDG